MYKTSQAISNYLENKAIEIFTSGFLWGFGVGVVLTVIVGLLIRWIW